MDDHQGLLYPYPGYTYHCDTETPKLPGVHYVAKNWALAMMLKAIGSVLERLLLKEQMMTSVRKTLKRWSGQPKNRSISNELFPEFNHKIGLF